LVVDQLPVTAALIRH